MSAFVAEVTGVVEMKKEDSTSEDDARVAAQVAQAAQAF